MPFYLLKDLPHETEEQRTFLFELSFFRRSVAYEPETKAELRSSHGRSRRGNPHSYYIMAPNGRTEVQNTATGYLRVPSYGHVCGVKAYTNETAIHIANNIFENKYQRFLKNPEKYRKDTEEELNQQRAWVAIWFGNFLDPNHRYYGRVMCDPATIIPDTEYGMTGLYRARIYHSHQPQLEAWVLIHDQGDRLVPYRREGMPDAR